VPPVWEGNERAGRVFPTAVSRSILVHRRRRHGAICLGRADRKV